MSDDAYINDFRRSVIHLALAATLIAPAAYSNVLEEVIVTAQKREQALQDVGIAVTAFSGDQMKALGFQNSTDVAAFSPGVHLASSSGGQLLQFTVRGVTQNDFYDGVEGPVAVYVDEGYIAAQQGTIFGLFDIERVEVLKGPQGTLFGRNATGGLVHYITNKPSFDETEGYAEITVGSYWRQDFEAAFGGPISDTVAARISGFYKSNDDYFDNDFPQGSVSTGPRIPGDGQDVGATDSWGLRLHTAFKLNDSADLLLSIHGAEATFDTPGYEVRPSIAEFDAQGRHINSYVASATETREAFGPGGVPVALDFVDGEFGDTVRPAGGDLFGFRDSDLGDFRSSHDFAIDDLNETEVYGATAKLEWSFDAFTLTSVTDYKTSEKIQGLDFGANPASQQTYIGESENTSFSQELRISGDTERLNWQAGVYYLDIASDTQNGVFSPTNSIFSPIFGAPGVGIDEVGISSLDTQSYSVFGQIDYDLSEQLALVAGLRFVREDKEFSYSLNAYVNENDLTNDTGAIFFPHRTGPGESNPFIDDSSEDLVAAKVQLDWRPNDDWLIYAGINRGVKAGSFNAPLAVPGAFPDSVLPYDDETLLSYEAGFKSTLFNGLARFNMAAFYYDYKDYQVFTFEGISGRVENGDATVKGIEVDLVASPVDGLDLLIGASFHDAEVENIEVAPGVLRDVEPTFAPDAQFNILARYGWPALGGELAIQADASYAASRWANIRNFTSHKLDSYTVTNARISWVSDEETWELSAFVNNMFDEEYVTDQFNLATYCGCDEQLFGKPRWAGATLRYNYF
ncbi:MAG: TonB-dependent receptor [Gammaproteobacteria bacterium]|nr:TonB-dependent receptor [Gammaproteobacteria bacterium]